MCSCVFLCEREALLLGACIGGESDYPEKAKDSAHLHISSSVLSLPLLSQSNCAGCSSQHKDADHTILYKEKYYLNIIYRALCHV
jgi:hypothetical protein